MIFVVCGIRWAPEKSERGDKSQIDKRLAFTEMHELRRQNALFRALGGESWTTQ